MSGTEAPESEDVQVKRWNLENLVRLGLTDTDAAYLAEARVSWHEAARLVRLGCPADEIVGILL